MKLFLKVLEDRVIGSTGAAGGGWSTVGSLSDLIAIARSQRRPLYLRPGIYRSEAIEVRATGSLQSLHITAEPGTVTIQLAAANPYLLRVDNVGDVQISNVSFDGANVDTGDTAPTAGLVRFSGPLTRSFELRNCDIHNARRAALVCEAGATGRVIDNRLRRCGSGVFCLDADVAIEANRIEACADNGVQIWTSRVAPNGSSVVRNHIDGIANLSGGTGQFGNGVVVFRAYGAMIADNVITSCRYSAIRLNAAGNCHVVRNRCSGAREVAIFVEAPLKGLDLDGGIVAENIIEAAGSGIQVANSGLYGDGTSRRVTVANNQISKLTRTYIPEEQAFTAAIGIIVEGSCNVVGNSIEKAGVAGIMVGTNNASTDLVVAGNFIHACPMGIGYSAHPAATGTLIANNLISGFTSSDDPIGAGYPHSGAIVSANFTGSDYLRDAPGGVANIDYGNAPPTTVGPLTIGVNKAR